MSQSIKRYGTTSATVAPETHDNRNKFVIFFGKIVDAVQKLSTKEYWTRVNAVEAWGFGTKLAIIIPGLIFEKQWWWLYIFAIASSIALIWTSTRKTLPTIIIFNVVWVLLATTAIIKHFAGW
jgi:hypothetical protein